MIGYAEDVAIITRNKKEITRLVDNTQKVAAVPLPTAKCKIMMLVTEEYHRSLELSSKEDSKDGKNMEHGY